jgi:hypothetical protein
MIFRTEGIPEGKSHITVGGPPRLFSVSAIRKDLVYPGSVVDPISTRTAEDLGFELGMFAGSVASVTVLRAADPIVLKLTEFAAQAHRICLQGHQPFAAEARAVHDSLRAFREGTPPGKIETAASDEMMKRLTRNGDYARWMKDWL